MPLFDKFLRNTPLASMILRWRSRQRLLVFGYHRVDGPFAADYPFMAGMHTCPDELRREIHFIRQNLDVISLDDLFASIDNPKLLPRRPALITFDDGYRDNHDNALPILREQHVPATFFISTGFIGTRRIPWWDEMTCCMKRSSVATIPSPFVTEPAPFELRGPSLPAAARRFSRLAKQLPFSQLLQQMEWLKNVTRVNPGEHQEMPLFMDWQQVNALREKGMEIGGHTRNHPALSNLESEEALDSEIAGCFEDLVLHTGLRPRVFSFPFGRKDLMTTAADRKIIEAGFKLSFAYVHGYASLPKLGETRVPRLQANAGEDYTDFLRDTTFAPHSPCLR